MYPKANFSFILILFVQFAFCQNEKSIHGKITVKDGNPQGVHIINLVNEKETISDEKGEFNIDAKIDDLLVFSSNHLDYQRKIIEDIDYSSASVKIEMTAKATQLDEVKIIKHPEFDAVKLGILTRPAKKFTPAERRLKAASEFKPIMLVNFLLGGALPLDPLINSLSGRTKMLKKELAVERQENLLSILSNLFSDQYYTQDLKINPEYIKGFQYYAIQNKNLAEALPEKNKTMIQLILVQLAFDYNNLQKADSNSNIETPLNSKAD